MRGNKSFVQRAWKFFSQPDEKQRAIMIESRSFLLFLTIVLTGMLAIIISSTPSLQEPGTFITLSVLMTVHVVLHWFSGWSSLYYNLSIAYLAIQGVLAVLIIVYSGEPQFGIGLFAALIGETIGIFGTSRISIIAIVSYLVLQPFAYYGVGGIEAIRESGPLAFSVNFMLIVIMTLLKRSMDSGDKAKALLSELEESHIKLAEYAAQVESLTLEEERARMARDLHDTLAQGLAGLVMQLEAAQHHLGTGENARAEEIIEQAMGRARTTLSGAREAIENLRNHQDVHLIALIKERVQRFSDATGIRCDLQFFLTDQFDVDRDIRDHTEKILGEALANIAVHARASLVTVRVLEDDIGFRLDIVDDGIGFIDGEVRRPGHYGLIGMRERARLIGGRLEVETEVNNGCRISALLPRTLPIEWRDS